MSSSATPWTEALQAPLSLGFSRQEHWSGLPFLFQGIFLTQGSNPHLLHWQVASLPPAHLGSPFSNVRAYQTVIQLKTFLLLSSREFSRVLCQEQNKHQICISPQITGSQHTCDFSMIPSTHIHTANKSINW